MMASMMITRDILSSVVLHCRTLNNLVIDICFIKGGLLLPLGDGY